MCASRSTRIAGGSSALPGTHEKILHRLGGRADLHTGKPGRGDSKTAATCYAGPRWEEAAYGRRSTRARLARAGHGQLVKPCACGRPRGRQRRRRLNHAEERRRVADNSLPGLTRRYPSQHIAGCSNNLGMGCCAQQASAASRYSARHEIYSHGRPTRDSLCDLDSVERQDGRRRRAERAQHEARARLHRMGAWSLGKNGRPRGRWCRARQIIRAGKSANATPAEPVQDRENDHLNPRTQEGPQDDLGTPVQRSGLRRLRCVAVRPRIWPGAGRERLFGYRRNRSAIRGTHATRDQHRAEVRTACCDPRPCSQARVPGSRSRKRAGLKLGRYRGADG